MEEKTQDKKKKGKCLGILFFVFSLIILISALVFLIKTPIVELECTKIDSMQKSLQTLGMFSVINTLEFVENQDNIYVKVILNDFDKKSNKHQVLKYLEYEVYDIMKYYVYGLKERNILPTDKDLIITEVLKEEYDDFGNNKEITYKMSKEVINNINVVDVKNLENVKWQKISE